MSDQIKWAFPGGTEGNWTVAQAKMFAWENDGRPVNVHTIDRLLQIEGKIACNGVVSDDGWRPADWRTVRFRDNREDNAPMAIRHRESEYTRRVHSHDDWVCTRPKGHPPTVHVAHTVAKECMRWPFETPIEFIPPPYVKSMKIDLGPGEHSFIPTAQVNEIYILDGSSPGATCGNALDLRFFAESDDEYRKRLHVVSLESQNLARKTTRINGLNTDDYFVSVVDELFRWACTQSVRDTERDRICRVLKPLLIERRGNNPMANK